MGVIEVLRHYEVSVITFCLTTWLRFWCVNKADEKAVEKEHCPTQLTHFPVTASKFPDTGARFPCQTQWWIWCKGIAFGQSGFPSLHYGPEPNLVTLRIVAERCSETEELILDTVNQEERHMWDQNNFQITGADPTGFYVLLCNTDFVSSADTATGFASTNLIRFPILNSTVQLASHQVGFGVKRSKCEAHHLLPSNSKVMRERGNAYQKWSKSTLITLQLHLKFPVC
jgi:hypothetical protein